MQIDITEDYQAQNSNNGVKLESLSIKTAYSQMSTQAKMYNNNIEMRKRNSVEYSSTSTQIKSASVKVKNEPIPMEITTIQATKTANISVNDMEVEPQDTLRKRNYKEHNDAIGVEENKLEAIKNALIQEECGTIDYGLNEHIAKGEYSNTKPLTKTINKKLKKHEDIYNSAWAPKEKLLLQEKSTDSQYLFTLWDLPKKTNAEEIKRYLEYFGTVSILAWQHTFRTKAAYIRIIADIERKENSLKESWSIHLDQSKTYRIIPGKFDITKLEERNRYKCTIRNI